MIAVSATHDRQSEAGTTSQHSTLSVDLPPHDQVMNGFEDLDVPAMNRE